MVWVRIDDHFDEHPKIARIDDHAFALFVAGLAYCNRNLTDGFIPYAVGHGQLRFCEGNPVPAIRQLESVGLWEEVEHGWQVHDYDQYQPSKADVLAEREAAKNRMSRVRAKFGRTASELHPNNGRSSDAPVPVPVPVNPIPSASSKQSARQRQKPGEVLQDEELMAELKARFPKVDVVWESEKWLDWCSSKPPKSPRLSWRNWVERAANGSANGKEAVNPELSWVERHYREGKARLQEVNSAD